jgi:hypothetical protein
METPSTQGGRSAACCVVLTKSAAAGLGHDTALGPDLGR